MKFLLDFELFLEARLADLLSIKGGEDTDFAKQIKKIQDSEFDLSKKLVRFITLKKRIAGKKVQFKINWNDNASHNLIKRIQDRTSFKSVEEFNSYFKSQIDYIFPDMVGKKLFQTGRYSLYSTEYNFTIIINFDIKEYTNANFFINVVTILPGKKGNNIVDFIDIQ